MIVWLTVVKVIFERRVIVWKVKKETQKFRSKKVEMLGDDVRNEKKKESPEQPEEAANQKIPFFGSYPASSCGTVINIARVLSMQ